MSFNGVRKVRKMLKSGGGKYAVGNSAPDINIPAALRDLRSLLLDADDLLLVLRGVHTKGGALNADAPVFAWWRKLRQSALCKRYQRYAGKHLWLGDIVGSLEDKADHAYDRAADVLAEAEHAERFSDVDMREHAEHMRRWAAATRRAATFRKALRKVERQMVAAERSVYKLAKPYVNLAALRRFEGDDAPEMLARMLCEKE